MKKVLLGLPIAFIFLAIFAGGVNNAVQILFLSIVCTLGLSLLIWIPLCWAIGWLILKIYWSRGEQIGVAIGETTYNQISEEISSLTCDRTALINYIEKGNRYGWSDTQIVTRLRAQGWSDAEIEEAQQIARNRG